MLVDEVRHRAQEWGLEHAPEIDPFAADAIRVVRGPGGVRYGSDALGGVVLVDPPELRREPGYNGELHAIGSSNGRGGAFAGRLQGVLEALPSISGQLEGSVKRLAAARAPDYALDNTRLFEWTAGPTIGHRGTASDARVSYRRYQAKLGVCACLRIHSVGDFLAQAEAGEPIGADLFEADFAIDRPYQTVAHDLAIARARWERDGLGTVTATYAFQHNLRREYDVVRQSQQDVAQFNFRLITNELQLVLEHNPLHLSEHWHVRGAAGVTAMIQTHAYTGLPLVPDFTAGGGGAFVTERLIGHDTEVEVGARYDLLSRTASLERTDFLRLVRSGQLAMDACGDATGDTVDCASTFHTFTGSLGAMQRLADGLSIKGDLSTASRAPNADEQYLNGAAPTFPVLGLGKPDLRPETTYATSLTLAYERPWLRAEASAVAHLIDGYMYFAPAVTDDGQPIFDVTIRGAFPRFTTRAVDALFYGADGGVTVSPFDALELSAQASLVRAEQRDGGGYLVFIPPDRYRGSATYKLGKSSATIAGTYVTRQTRFDPLADFIAPPPAYFLLDAELATELSAMSQPLRISLQGQNLTNTRYRDYTSLMRYFADEPGWQLWLRVTLLFDSKGS